MLSTTTLLTLIIWSAISGCMALHIENELPDPIRKPISVRFMAEQGLRMSDKDRTQLHSAIKNRLAEELFHIREDSTIRVVGTINSVQW